MKPRVVALLAALVACNFLSQAADDLEEALLLCVSGYTPGSALPNGTLACLPPWPEECLRVENAGGLPQCQIYTAAAGDTVDSLAAAFGLSDQELFATNPLHSGDTIPAGEPVYIPPCGSMTAPGSPQPPDGPPDGLWAPEPAPVEAAGPWGVPVPAAAPAGAPAAGEQPAASPTSLPAKPPSAQPAPGPAGRATRREEPADGEEATQLTALVPSEAPAPGSAAAPLLGAPAPAPQVAPGPGSSNDAVKHCVKLRESSKYRREVGAALVSGADLVVELAPYCAPYRALVGLEEAQLPDGIAAERYVTATAPVMQKIAGLGSVGAGALAAEAALPPTADLLGGAPGQLRRVLALDGVQDPGNLGTLLRTALALGWQAAVLLPGCCDPYNDKALRASRGAVFKLPLAQYSLGQWQQLVEEQRLVPLAADPSRAAAAAAADARGTAGRDGSGSAAARQQQHGQAAAPEGDVGALQQRLAQLPVCLCLGAEGQGLSAGVRERCVAVSIPQSGGGELMESLNVSAAGAILMFALSQGSAPLLVELAGL
ncbi:hypothetical protein CHLNCDRAFT_133965 [Chlorella variabilis]|uniref:LysM domain-containing protein n=1 Tax=Chlorella variabilis TaxID=554065 RepID=E1ZEP0_CHLVA|nr:hypothetical protein CHLNCDRAFT_133965 [Chlorella variabilis]EFN55529.1 hypothetical protein CHLNCDRAFT_133965 [Chlorella variabilis]|eukprot:XP_005847631.1 hypothetical protein CHLNCDRAFT_133965 [Chlorella variabilis]